MLRGWNISHTIVDLEGMGIEEQIHQFATTQVVVGQHGAGLSNLMFMQPGTTVIEIGIKDYECYENLAKQLDLRYTAFTPIEWTKDIEVTVDKAVHQMVSLI